MLWKCRCFHAQKHTEAACGAAYFWFLFVRGWAVLPSEAA